MKEKQIVYITKYALGAKGEIVKKSVEPIDGGYVRDGKSFSGGGFGFLSPSAFTLSESDAFKKCEAMRAKKITSLRKQIAALEAMTFRIVPR